MPLIGHTFAGLVTAGVVSCSRSGTVAVASRGLLGHFLAPLAVAFAYLPDIVSQALLVAGYRDGRWLGHSFAASGVLAMIGFSLLRRCGLSNSAAAALPLAGLASHLALDSLQSTDLRPWWPLSERPLLADPLLPAGPGGEAIIAAVLLLTWRLLRWRQGNVVPRKTSVQNLPKSLTSVISALLVGVIVAVALSVFLLRESRERQLERARQLVEAGRIEEGFVLLDKADGWPATAKPGRIDYYRGVGHLKRGERDRARECFLMAYRADPRYFWVVLDLAIWYAGDNRPPKERRAAAEPYLRALAEGFSGRPEARRGLEEAERLLVAGEAGREAGSLPGEE